MEADKRQGEVSVGRDAMASPFFACLFFPLQLICVPEIQFTLDRALLKSMRVL